MLQLNRLSQHAHLQQRPQRLPSRALSVVCSVRARWSIDVRYGCKLEATALLQEWVREIGSKAGLNAANTRLSSGAVGVPESRLEMEVTFNNLSEWEQFLGSIPFKDHKAWSQRIQSMVTNDDSPKWQIFRAVPVDVDTGLVAIPAVTSSSTKTQQLPRIVPEASGKREWVSSSYDTSESPSPGASPLTLIEDSAAAEVVLDWKGDPMTISPGDKLPFKFL